MPREPSLPSLRLLQAQFDELVDTAERQRRALAVELGMGELEVQALLALVESGPLSLGELGRRLQRSSRTATRLGHRLGAGGYVTKSRNSATGQQSLIAPTPKATQIVDAFFAPINQAIDQFFSQVPDSEIDVVLEVLDEIVNISEQRARRLRGR